MQLVPPSSSAELHNGLRNMKVLTIRIWCCPEAISCFSVVLFEVNPEPHNAWVGYQCGTWVTYWRLLDMDQKWQVLPRPYRAPDRSREEDM